MIKLDYALAVSLLRQAVEDRGADYVYTGPDDERSSGDDIPCRYAHHGPDGELTPGCIVGYVLHAAGAPLRELHQYEGQHAAALLGGLRAARLIEITDRDLERVNDLLGRAQRHQDRGVPWGAALRLALEMEG